MKMRILNDSRVVILVALALLTATIGDNSGLIECVTHLKVQDGGKIEAKTDTPYTLLRPYDLTSFIQQSGRISLLRELGDMISSKEHINKYGHTKLYVPTSVATYQENFYKTDPDCVRAGQPLTKFQFYETHYNIWKVDETSFPKDVLQIRQEDLSGAFKKPNCLNAPLPFNMGTFDHLESIANKDLISMAPELELLDNIFVVPEDFYGHIVAEALLTNNTSWMYLTMASDFYRLKGDYANSVKCLQRAIYHAPRPFATLPVLSLSNCLHKLHFTNDSLAIALSSLSFDPLSPLFAYHIGNIYVTLGDLNLAFNAYEKSHLFDPMFKQAYSKKHAVLCHLKLEQYLEEQHLNLQKKLDEIKEYQVLTEQWIHESASVELEKSSPDRRETTAKFYENHFKPRPSTVCRWDYQDLTLRKRYVCTDLEFHFTLLESFADLGNGSALSHFSTVKELDESADRLGVNSKPSSLGDELFLTPKKPECHQLDSPSLPRRTVPTDEDDGATDLDLISWESTESPPTSQVPNKFTNKLLAEKAVENHVKIPDYISIF